MPRQGRRSHGRGTVGGGPRTGAGRGSPATADGRDDGAVGAAVEVISLDVGGVLVVPEHVALAVRLDEAGVAHRPEAFAEGHYHAMAAVDRAQSEPETFGDYLDGFLVAVGVAEHERAAGRAALAPWFGAPAWRQPLPWAADGLRALAGAGLRLVVTSNSDGTVAAMLREVGLAQVGPGPGVEVEAVVDSGVVGVAKPDPALYAHTVAAAGVAPERILHVGDSVHYDVHGAAAAGLRSVHFDPHALCRDDGHDHVARLEDVLVLVDDLSRR